MMAPDLLFLIKFVKLATDFGLSAFLSLLPTTTGAIRDPAHPTRVGRG